MTIYNNKEYVKIIRPLPEDWPRGIEGIPFIRKSDIDISDINNGKQLINMSNISNSTKKLDKKIAHCFKYDKVLNRFYNDPFLMLEKLTKCYASCTLDFSMYDVMQRAQIIDATFKNRWSGAYLQANGFERVIVTVGWVDPDTYDICFSGIVDGTVLMISTLGVCNDHSKETFMKGYVELRKRFPNSKIICLGNFVEGMDTDVCFVNYSESFGVLDKNENSWQQALYNWDLSEAIDNGF